MQSVKSLKSVSAILLALAVLIGMLAVVGTLPLFSSADATVKEFVADFSEMAAGTVAAGGEDWVTLQEETLYGGSSQTIAFDNPSSTTATAADVYANQWMSARFDIVAHYNGAEPSAFAWYAQQIPSDADPYDWSKLRLYKHDTALGGGQWLSYQGKGQWVFAEMFRVNTSLIAKEDGRRLYLKNFEAELKFAFENNDCNGSIALSFHQETGGKYTWQASGDYVGHTGNTVVIGNGAHEATDSATANVHRTKDGWQFYTDDERIQVKTVGPIDGRFGKNLSDQWYTLKVRVVNKQVVMTITGEDGIEVDRIEKAVTTEAGQISVALSNRRTHLKSFKVVELNSKGDPVDLGTYYDENSGKVFSTNFAQMTDDAAAKGDKEWAPFMDEPAYGNVNSQYIEVTDPTADSATAVEKYAANWMSQRLDTVSYYSGDSVTKHDWFAQPVSTDNYDFSFYTMYNHESALGGGSWLYYRHLFDANLRPGEMVRMVTSMVAKKGNKQVKLQNFEAELEFAFRDADTKGAVLLSFHQEVGGKYTHINDADYVSHTGNTLVIGNGGLDAQGDGSKDGWSFYNKEENINNKYVSELFDKALTDQWYTLTVKVIGSEAIITLKGEDGVQVATMTKAITTTGGVISFGVTNRNTHISNFKVVELDEQGNQVDLGTYHTLMGIERFSADFTQMAEGTAAQGDKDWTTFLDGDDNSKRIALVDPTTDGATAADRFASDWMGQRFDTVAYYSGDDVTDYSWFGQTTPAAIDTNEASFYTPYKNETILGGGSWLFYRYHFTTSYEPPVEMLRVTTSMVAKQGGNRLDLQNFEAELEFAFNDSTRPGGLVLSFHETNGGYYDYIGSPTEFAHTGNTIVIGNGGDLVNDGWSFYPQTQNVLYNEVGDRFGKALTDQWYTLKVRVVGSEAVITLTGEDGVVVATKTETIANNHGQISFGVSDRLTHIKRFSISELDAAGQVVDLGSNAATYYYDEENTVLYDFSDAAQLEDFDAWYLPTAQSKKPLISVNNENNNWYVEDNALKFKTSSLFTDPNAFKGNGIEVGGILWKNEWPAWQSNFGVAVLKNKAYENFILDVDFQGCSKWVTFGFGAKNTDDGTGVFWTNEDGGYAFFLEAESGGKGSVDFQYQTPTGTKAIQERFKYDYNATGTHHMRIIVSEGTAYLSLDDQEAWAMVLPEEYDGGHIYLALQDASSYFDNLRIVDLDAKTIEITEAEDVYEDVTVDRSMGERLSLSMSAAYGKTAEGYEYPLLVEFVNEEYRSYKNGVFDFKFSTPLKNITIADSLDIAVTVNNKISGEFDTTVSKRYYFDHPNDFLDFGAYYAQKQVKENYWSASGDPNPNEYWTSFDAQLVEAQPSELWKVAEDGSVTTTQLANNAGTSPVERLRNLSTLILEADHYMNFRLEIDVLQSTRNYWYNYVMFGVQDPTRPYAGLKKNNGALSTGHETSFLYNDDTANGGIWAFMEQEGTFNFVGNLDGGRSQRIVSEPKGYEFIKNFNKTKWQHVTIEVVNGVMRYQVSNDEYESMPLYFNISYDAYGGYVGFGNNNCGGEFKNFQITALDRDGNEVPLEEGQQGWKLVPAGNQYHPGWDPANDKLWEFDWSKRHTE